MLTAEEDFNFRKKPIEPKVTYSIQRGVVAQYSVQELPVRYTERPWFDPW